MSDFHSQNDDGQQYMTGNNADNSPLSPFNPPFNFDDIVINDQQPFDVQPQVEPYQDYRMTYTNYNSMGYGSIRHPSDGNGKSSSFLDTSLQS
jgi:hypothetical protein